MESESGITISPNEAAAVAEALGEGIDQLLLAAAYAQTTGDLEQSESMFENADKAAKVKDRLVGKKANFYHI